MSHDRGQTTSLQLQIASMQNAGLGSSSRDDTMEALSAERNRHKKSSFHDLVHMAEIEQSRFRNGSGRARDCDHSLLVGAR